MSFTVDDYWVLIVRVIFIFYQLDSILRLTEFSFLLYSLETRLSFQFVEMNSRSVCILPVAQSKPYVNGAQKNWVWLKIFVGFWQVQSGFYWDLGGFLLRQFVMHPWGLTWVGYLIFDLIQFKVLILQLSSFFPIFYLIQFNSISESSLKLVIIH